MTAEMSLKTYEALGRGEPGLLFRMQNSYDLWQAEHSKRKKVKLISQASARVVDVSASRVA